MLGWVPVSTAHFVDDRGLSDGASGVNTAKVQESPSSKSPSSAPVHSWVIGHKKVSLAQDRDH